MDKRKLVCMYRNFEDKLAALILFVFWLFAEPHPLGVQVTIEGGMDGRSWFIADQKFVMIQAEQVDDYMDGEPFVVDGKKYVRVGGGEQEGKLIYIGEA